MRLDASLELTRASDISVVSFLLQQHGAYTKHDPSNASYLAGNESEFV